MTLVDRLGDTIKEAKADRLSHTQSEVEVEALINIMADTLPERKVKTFLNTPGVAQAMKLVYTLGDTVGKTPTGNLQHTVANTIKVNTWQNSGNV